jgi:pyrroline-5-carboxylate reductase
MKIGFIGAGKMARALAAGMVHQKLAAPLDIFASARTDSSRDQFLSAFPNDKPRWTTDNLDVMAQSDVVVLAVKPQMFAVVLPPLADAARGKLIISVAAGLPLARLRGWLGADARLVRAMPNTPCLVGFGATAYAFGPDITEADEIVVRQILGATGLAVQVEEEQINAVTALSGSGPAYFFHILDGLIEGAVAQGLPVALARTLALQTALGSVKMMELTGEDPNVLAAQVKSPGGTTMAGCAVLESRGLHEMLLETVAAARQRADELGAA